MYMHTHSKSPSRKDLMSSLGTMIIRTISSFQLLQGLLQPQGAVSPVFLLFQGYPASSDWTRRGTKAQLFWYETDTQEAYLPHRCLTQVCWGFISLTSQFNFSLCPILLSHFLSQMFSSDKHDTPSPTGSTQFWRIRPMTFSMMTIMDEFLNYLK